MGLLKFFSRSRTLDLPYFSGGSFTVDSRGRILASTLPQSFPAQRVQEIAEVSLSAFRSAGEASMLLTELVVDYATLRLTARQLGTGLIVFLAPRGPTPKPSNSSK
jgi:hypothetical protein